MGRASDDRYGRITGRRWQLITARVLETKGTTCALCTGAGADSADHITTLAAGGHPTDLANLQPAHISCNKARGQLTMAQWRATHPLPHRPALQPSREW